MLPLTYAVSTVLNGSGNGTASAGPSLTNEVWTVPLTVSVKCSTNVNEAICTVYAGSGVNASTFQDATTWGSTGDSDNSVNQNLYCGMRVYAVWTGGDSAATATMVVTGTRQVP